MVGQDVRRRHNLICQPQYLVGHCLHAKIFFKNHLFSFVLTHKHSLYTKNDINILWKNNNYKRGKKVNVLILSFNHCHCHFESQSSHSVRTSFIIEDAPSSSVAVSDDEVQGSLSVELLVRRLLYCFPLMLIDAPCFFIPPEVNTRVSIERLQ